MSFARKIFMCFLLVILITFPTLGTEKSEAASADITGTWINTSPWGGTITITQTGTDGVKWTATSNSGLWTQTFSGSWLTVWAVTGVFLQTEPNSNPKSYDGTLRFRVDDASHACHFTIAYAGVITGAAATVDRLKGLEFTKTGCASPSPSPSISTAVQNIVWPTLPSAYVSLETVSNGCGGGDAGTDPMYGDDSEYVDSEIPLGQSVKWLKAKKYLVNFREACKQHDAAYSHAMVREMALNGGVIMDYFTWTKQRIDTKFLADMIKICEHSIPKSAKIALNNCKNYGGWHTVSGAKTRYNLVATTTYSQKIWKGLGFYQDAPALTGNWTVPGISTGPWSFYQSNRNVNVKWSGGSAQPGLTGEFRGTLISHDKDSTIQGFYVTTQNGASTNPRAMSFAWSPATPTSLKSSNGFSLIRS